MDTQNKLDDDLGPLVNNLRRIVNSFDQSSAITRTAELAAIIIENLHKEVERLRAREASLVDEIEALEDDLAYTQEELEDAQEELEAKNNEAT